MAVFIGILIQLGIPALFVLLGLIAGRVAEDRHLRSLGRRERQLAGIFVTNQKTFLGPVDISVCPSAVTGQAVIASDYLKTFLAALKKIIGGELRSYQTLMSHARREAILRLKYQAHQLGCNAVCNVRLYTSDIGGGTRRKGAAMVEMFAVGTAYLRKPED